MLHRSDRTDSHTLSRSVPKGWRADTAHILEARCRKNALSNRAVPGGVGKTSRWHLPSPKPVAAISSMASGWSTWERRDPRWCGRACPCPGQEALSDDRLPSMMSSFAASRCSSGWTIAPHVVMRRLHWLADPARPHRPGCAFWRQREPCALRANAAHECRQWRGFRRVTRNGRRGSSFFRRRTFRP